MNAKILGAVVAALISSETAQATSVTLNFPSSNSIVDAAYSNGVLGAGGGGAYFNAGDTLSEAFNTSLPVVTGANWTFTMSNYTAPGVTSTFNVLINRTTVDSYSFTSSCPPFSGYCAETESFAFSESFAPISGPNYRLALVATSTVYPGGGSWNWYPGGQVTLAVPEPSTWSMVFIGFAGLALASYRRTSPQGATSPAAA
jgi:hypothetical protein